MNKNTIKQIIATGLIVAMVSPGTASAYDNGSEKYNLKGSKSEKIGTEADNSAYVQIDSDNLTSRENIEIENTSSREAVNIEPEAENRIVRKHIIDFGVVTKSENDDKWLEYDQSNNNTMSKYITDSRGKIKPYIYNGSKSNMTDIIIYMSIPKVNDSEGSMFNMQLMKDEIIWLDATTTIEYTTSDTPTKEELTGGTDTEYNKLELISQDEYDKVTMLKIKKSEIKKGEDFNVEIPIETKDSLLHGEQSKYAYINSDIKYKAEGRETVASLGLAGYKLTPMEVSGRVWLDGNRNGIREPQEAGLEDYEVNLLDDTGTVISTSGTNINGEYTINIYKKGTYNLKVIPKGNDKFTFKNASGTNSMNDSDFDSFGVAEIEVKGAVTDNIDAGIARGVDFSVDESISKVVLKKHKDYTLNYTVVDGAGIITKDDVTFKSSDNDVVKVDSLGKLTAVEVGTAEIMVTCPDGFGGLLKEQVLVEVIGNEGDIINGAEDLTIKMGQVDTFDPLAGITLTDDDDSLTSADITVTGTLGKPAAGTDETYVLTYTVRDRDGNVTEVVRNITVTNQVPTIAGLIDMTIKEGKPMDLVAGVTASDMEDGDITSSMIISGVVDVNTPGEYKLSYTVTDSDGNTTTISRIVTVERDKVIVEGDKVIVEGDKVIVEGDKVIVESDKVITPPKDNNTTPAKKSNKVTITEISNTNKPEENHINNTSGTSATSNTNNKDIKDIYEDEKTGNLGGANRGNKVKQDLGFTDQDNEKNCVLHWLLLLLAGVTAAGTLLSAYRFNQKIKKEYGEEIEEANEK